MTVGSAMLTPHDHAVSFYDHDADLVADVARFVADGLDLGDRVVVVATAAHRAAIDEVLLQYGTDAVRARVHGRYLALDAAETLTGFMVDGMPDAARCADRLGAVLDAAGEDGCGVRVFGEMVSVLWDEGNVAAALALEGLWNQLGSGRQFSLFCAYPIAAAAVAELIDLQRVCDLHSSVRPPRSYATTRVADSIDRAARRSEVFVPVPEAVPAVRRFVDRTLRSWGEHSAMADAILVVSELATNAVRHAASPFRAVVARADGRLRIAVEDVGPAHPALRDVGPDDFGGRGVAIVASLSDRWGCDTLPHGKSVWAEMDSVRGR